MRATRSLPTVLLPLLPPLALLAGCGDDDSPPPADASSSPSASDTAGASPGEEPSASSEPGRTGSSSSAPKTGSTPQAEDQLLPHDRIEAASLHTAVLGRNAAASADEHAVVDTWIAYWQGAADTYYYYRPTPRLLAASTGKARAAVIKQMREKRAQNHRIVGWAVDNVTAVEIDGDTATVRDCVENYTYTVDREIEPLTHPTPWYAATGTLQKQGDHWVVVDQTSEDRATSCL